MIFEIYTTEIAAATYTVAARSAKEAREKLLRGEWLTWRDLGHDDLDIIEVRPSSGPEETE